MAKIIWQNANGTWSHHRNRKCEWVTRNDCATDLRFHEEMQ